MGLPVAVVLVVGWHGADCRTIEGEGGIPVGNRLLVGDPFDLRHEVPSHRGPLHPRDSGDPQAVALLLDTAVERLGAEETDVDDVPRRHRVPLGGKIVGHPLVDDDPFVVRQRERQALVINEPSHRQ